MNPTIEAMARGIMLARVGRSHAYRLPSLGERSAYVEGLIRTNEPEWSDALDDALGALNVLALVEQDEPRGAMLAELVKEAEGDA